MVASGTKQIAVQRSIYESYRIYARLKNVSTESVIAHALQDWINVEGQGEVEDMLGTEPSKALDRLIEEAEGKIPPLPLTKKKLDVN